MQYATATTLLDQRERGTVSPDQPADDALTTWLDWWLSWTGAALVQGYLDVAEGHPFLPADPDHARTLLDAFVIEKAVYELDYELNNRPDWVGIPVAGILQVLDRDER